VNYRNTRHTHTPHTCEDGATSLLTSGNPHSRFRWVSKQDLSHAVVFSWLINLSEQIFQPDRREFNRQIGLNQYPPF
jgi:hypothetical protein